MARKNSKDKGIVENPTGSGIWWVDCYLNGRRFRKKVGNKTATRNFYQKLKTEAMEHRLFPEKYERRVCLSTWIDQYLEGSINRSVQNEKYYGRFWKHLLGNHSLDKITTGDLRRIQAKMRAKEKRSPATINRFYAFLRHVLQIAVRDGLISRNPISGIKFFPESSRTRFLSEDEIRGLQKVMEHEDWKLVALALLTGLRREEQFSLRWDQIDFDNRIITTPMPKGGKTRHIPMNTEALDILRSLYSLFTSPWVFPRVNDTLKPFSAQFFVNKKYTPALRKAGIVGVCWHTLRHTAASRLAMAGVDLLTVKEILGHRDIQTTLRYAHLAPGHIHEAIKKLQIGTGTDTGTDTKETERVDAEMGNGL